MQFHSIGFAERHVQRSIKKQSRRSKQYSLWQLRFCQAQKPWKRKETERMYSLRTHFGALLGRDGEEEEPLASVVFPPSTIAKQCTKCHAATQASHWSLWLPSMLSRLENGWIHAQAPRIVRSQSTVNRSTEFEVTTSLRRNTVCTSVILGYGVKMKDVFASQCNVQVVTFFLRSWQRRRWSEIGCYSAWRGAAIHCIAWEMFEHWRKNNQWVRVWEFFVMKWPGLISLEKPKRKDISLHDRSWAWWTRLFKFKWRKPCVGLRHFLGGIFLSKLVCSWRRPICREMTGISRHDYRSEFRKHTGRQEEKPRKSNIDARAQQKNQLIWLRSSPHWMQNDHGADQKKQQYDRDANDATKCFDAVSYDFDTVWPGPKQKLSTIHEVFLFFD